MANEQVTADEIRNEVKKLVAEITEREPEEISDTALFMDELGIDSLMAIEMLVAMTKRYKIEISEEEFGKIKNVNEAVVMVQQHLAQRATKAE